MLLHRFQNGDELDRRHRALVVTFGGPRDVLSTSPFNGGYRDNLKYVFNHDCKENGNKHTPLKAPTYEEHMKTIASELGLDRQYACGLSTAADMENVSIQAETFDDLTVTAVVTGGIDVNGGRVGDPADWHESNGVSKHVTGTINIMLFIDAHLPEGTLTRALVTCTEAKTAALQELLAPSICSSGIATGSGTDGTIVVTNPLSHVYLTYAGKHSKLGELIGRTVMKAVKEALYLQTGLCAAQQFDIFSRIARYGITRQSIFDSAPNADIGKLDALSKRNELVVMTSLYVHLLDQLQWGLISPEDALSAAQQLLRGAGLDMALLGVSQGSPPENALLLLYRLALMKLL
jgi:adenosylcobinamide amidohydrolase